jgi:hypothetical protein
MDLPAESTVLPALAKFLTGDFTPEREQKESSPDSGEF